MMVMWLGKGEDMEKDFEDFIFKRCETALLENEEYLKLEQDGSDNELIQELAETICYKKGFSDAIKLINLK